MGSLGVFDLEDCLAGEPDELDAVGDPEFFADAFTVAIDSRDRSVQAFCDLFLPESLAH